MFEQPKIQGKEEQGNEITKNSAEIYAREKYVKDYDQLMNAPRTLKFFRESSI